MVAELRRHYISQATLPFMSCLGGSVDDVSLSADQKESREV